MPAMNPATAIAPRRMTRRMNAKRWHLVSEDGFMTARTTERTMCGQTLGSRAIKVAYNANEITCNDCLVAAISRRGAR